MASNDRLLSDQPADFCAVAWVRCAVGPPMGGAKWEALWGFLPLGCATEACRLRVLSCDRLRAFVRADAFMNTCLSHMVLLHAVSRTSSFRGWPAYAWLAQTFLWQRETRRLVAQRETRRFVILSLARA